MYYILVETLSSAILLIPIFLLLWKVKFHDLGKTAFYTVFAVYLSAVYFLTGLPTVRFFRFDVSLNLIPFAGMAADLKNEIKNVLLFIPLGILLPLLWEKYRTIKDTLLFGLGMTLAIELLQLFTYRATDINDIITNFLGTVIGYFLFAILQKKVPSVVKAGKRNDVFLIVVIVFAVMFFVQPLIVSFIYSAT